MLGTILIWLIALFIIFVAVNITIASLNPEGKGLIVQIVRPTHKMLIERNGNFNRIGGPGLVWHVPIFEKAYKVDIRVKPVDFPAQTVITRDNASIEIDALILSQIVDVKKAQYRALFLDRIISNVSMSNLRNIIGGMTLEEVVSSRMEINNKLHQALDNIASNLGAMIVRVDIQDIALPDNIREAMNKKLIAKGERDAKIIAADAEAKYDKMVFTTVRKYKPPEEWLRLKSIEALEKMADGKATKMFLPLNLASILGPLEALRETFIERRSDSKALEKGDSPPLEDTNQ